VGDLDGSIPWDENGIQPGGLALDTVEERRSGELECVPFNLIDEHRMTVKITA
jgi:hypothetical protein